VRESLEKMVESLGGDSSYVIVAEGRMLRDEILYNLSQSSILIADISSSSRKNATKGPRPAVMWEIGIAETLGMGMTIICREKDRDLVPEVLKPFHIIYYDIDNLAPMLKEARGALQKIIARQTASPLKVFQARCYANRKVCDLEVRYLEAEHSIAILELNLETVNVESIKGALSLAPDLSVQILTLNPFSKFAGDRAHQLAQLPRTYSRQLYKAVKSTYDKLTEIPRDRWDLRIYDTFPTQITFQIDEALIHSIICLGKRSRDMLHFEVQESQPNASDTFQAHFAQLWSSSPPFEEWYDRNKIAVTDLIGKDIAAVKHVAGERRKSSSKKKPRKLHRGT
jgi:hypothetical protein